VVSNASPRAPVGLGKPGRQVWREVWQLPRVSAADRLSVESLARLADEAERLRAVLKADGFALKKPVQSARGEVIGEEWYSHPANASLRGVGREMAALCAELGLTPASRKRLGLGVVPDDRAPDALDELQAARRRRRTAVQGRKVGA
jgi:P27 family predicted phage terminase small subunit